MLAPRYPRRESAWEALFVLTTNPEALFVLTTNGSITQIHNRAETAEDL